MPRGTRTGDVLVGKEKLRLLVEAAARARDAGALMAADATVDPAMPGSPTGVSLGVDGVLVLTVTRTGPFDVAQGEDERRKDQAVRRHQRSASGVGNAKPLPPARPGTDQRYTQLRIGPFPDQPTAHRHEFATAADGDAFGPPLAAHAAAVGFERADQSLSLTDGARWIAAQICLVLTSIPFYFAQGEVMLLDSHHPSQHVP